MPTINIFIAGDPKAQPRARRAGNRGGVYNPGTADEWKSRVKLGMNIHSGLMIDEPIECNLVFLFDRPKRLMRKKDHDGLIPHTSKPDKDNLEKAVFDCLSAPNKSGRGGIGVWRDDALVFSGKTEKYYCKKGGQPGVWIYIKWGDSLFL